MSNLVTLLDTMGNDLAVVNAARVSFSKTAEYDENGTLKPEDVKLIRYLAREGHKSPFYHVQAKFHFVMPIFVKNQWFRHTVSLSRNEASRRYIKSEPTFFLPEYFRPAAENVKQGSEDKPMVTSDYWKTMYGRQYEVCKQLYLAALNDGMCAEQARIILPQAMMTEFVETGSLYAFFNIWRERTHPNAQKEIADYARMVGELLAAKFPVSWEALTNYL